MNKLPDDPRFRHVSYRHTDIRKTFARERKRLAEEAERKALAEAEAGAKVRKIQRGQG